MREAPLEVLAVLAGLAIMFGCMEQSGMTFLQYMTELAHFFESSMTLKERGYKWGYIFIKKYKSLTFSDLYLVLWSWRGLNPRPNVELIRFLHA